MPESTVFWNRKASGYDARIKKAENYAARLERAWALMPANACVLDVGCATGEITLDLAPGCGSILGIDHAEKMAEAGNAKARERGVGNCRFEARDAFDLALAEGSFDVITNYSLLHLVEDAPATIRRLAALLKPGGYLVTEVPCLGDWNAGWRMLVPVMVTLGVAPPIRKLRRADMEAAMRAAGLEIRESRVYNPSSGQHGIIAQKT